MSHQDGFGNNRTEPARPTKPDNDDDGMQKKSKDVAHSQDGTKRKKLKNSRRFRNSPPTGQEHGRFSPYFKNSPPTGQASNVIVKGRPSWFDTKARRRCAGYCRPQS